MILRLKWYKILTPLMIFLVIKWIKKIKKKLTRFTLIVNNRRQSARNVLQEGGHGVAVANAAVRQLGGGQHDHRVQQLQRGDNRLEQEPHAVHQGDPAIPQVWNHPYQPVPQNAGRHEPEAVNAQYQDVFHRNINVGWIVFKLQPISLVFFFHVPILHRVIFIFIFSESNLT